MDKQQKPKRQARTVKTKTTTTGWDICMNKNARNAAACMPALPVKKKKVK